MTDRTEAPNTYRILVIDDEPDIRRLLRLALEEAGYEVWEAQEGEDGLAIARQKECDLAIVDLFMPGKEGLETILALRRDMPQIKLIAMICCLRPDRLAPTRPSINPTSSTHS